MSPSTSTNRIEYSLMLMLNINEIVSMILFWIWATGFRLGLSGTGKFEKNRDLLLEFSMPQITKSEPKQRKKPGISDSGPGFDKNRENIQKNGKKFLLKISKNKTSQIPNEFSGPGLDFAQPKFRFYFAFFKVLVWIHPGFCIFRRCLAPSPTSPTCLSH